MSSRRSVGRLSRAATGSLATLALLVSMAGPAAADVTPPAAVGVLTAQPGDDLVVLRWVNPLDSDFAGVVVRQSLGDNAPDEPDDGSLVYSGTGSSVVVDGLHNGAKYSWSVFSRDAVPNFSQPVSVTAIPLLPAPTTLVISRTAAAVTYGQSFTLRGWLLRSEDRAGVKGEKVEVFYRTKGTLPWRGLKALTSGDGGFVSLAIKPTVNTEYQLRHPLTPFYGGSTSSTTDIGVRPSLTARLSPVAIERGKSAVISVAVAPGHPGQAVELQQLVDNAWQTAQSRNLASNSATSFTVAPTVLGGYSYRVVRAADADHLSGTSGLLRLSVTRRTLSQGMTGADVAEVQRRLTALRYDPATTSGTFNYDTRHAVLAFQKVNGMTRDGVVTPAVWDRLLAAPAAFRLRYNHGAGRWVEIDLTRQVLVLAEKGAVRRILDVSSGNNQLYTVDGQTSRAVTPRGNFSVLRKINGVRVSRLGELYRPAYFVGGYAVHGSSSVPSYPASHGCVRITNPAMDRLYDLLVRGTPVHVYD